MVGRAGPDPGAEGPLLRLPVPCRAQGASHGGVPPPPRRRARIVPGRSRARGARALPGRTARAAEDRASARSGRRGPRSRTRSRSSTARATASRCRPPRRLSRSAVMAEAFTDAVQDLRRLPLILERLERVPPTPAGMAAGPAPHRCCALPGAAHGPPRRSPPRGGPRLPERRRARPVPGSHPPEGRGLGYRRDVPCPGPEPLRLALARGGGAAGGPRGGAGGRDASPDRPPRGPCGRGAPLPRDGAHGPRAVQRRRARAAR